MNSQRTNMNWASAALSIVFVALYLFAPFYTATTIGIVSTSFSGFNLISSNVIAILPVILGILMAVAACCFPPLAAFIVEALGTIVTMGFMFLGNTIPAANFTFNASQSISDNVVNNMGAFLSMGAKFHPDWGAFFCVGLCIAALVVDILANRSAKPANSPYVMNMGQQIGNTSNNANDLFDNSGFGSNNNNNLF